VPCIRFSQLRSVKAPLLPRPTGLTIGLLLLTTAGAQQRLSDHIEQLPPLVNTALHQQFVEILTQMDRFSAEGSMAAIGKAFRSIDPEQDLEANYYLHCFRAEVLYYEGLFHEGITDLDKAEVLAHQLGDSLLIANVYNLKGLLHENIQDNRLALPLLRNALAWFPRKAAARYPVSELYHIHGNMGSYLTNLGRLDSAGIHLLQSLELASKADAPRAIAVAWWSLGNLALVRNLPDSALACYEHSAAVADAKRDHDIGVDALVGRADALQALGDKRSVEEAITYAMDYLHTHGSGIGLVTQRNAHRLVAKVVQHMGRPDLALDHMAQWFRIDSLIAARNIRSALAIQGELLRTDADLAIERLERERYAEALERVRFSRTVIIVGSAMGLLILLGLYFGYRGRQRGKQRVAELEVLRLQQERTIAELRIREEVGRDMHDDLGAGLSALKLRSEMALRKENDPDKRKFLSTLATTAGELIVNMRQIIWTMNADQGTLADLVVYIGNYARTYLDGNALRFELLAPEELPEVTLSAQQRRNMLLVVKEALHNIVKHAHATEVLIAISCAEGLTISIVDNGNGLPRHADLGVGNGIRNMARRMEIVGGTFRVESMGTEDPVEDQSGTRLRFHMPVDTNKGSIADRPVTVSPSHP
jgi:signal transduction histidine kinase